MATYKEIHGINIEAVSSDPSNPVEGQVWYNTTSNVLKGERPTLLGSWATGGSLNTARYGAGSAAANNTAAVVFGGYPPVTGATEEWVAGTTTKTVGAS